MFLEIPWQMCLIAVAIQIRCLLVLCRNTGKQNRIKNNSKKLKMKVLFSPICEETSEEEE